MAGVKKVDHIAIAVLVLVECALIFSICFQQDDCLGVFTVDICEQHISIVSFIGKHIIGKQIFQQGFSLRDVIALSAG